MGICINWLNTSFEAIKKTFNKKIILLINAIDQPLIAAHRHNYFLDRIKNFYDLFIDALIRNPNLDKVIMTGTYLIPQLNRSDVTIDSVFKDNGFGDCYGFTDEELRVYLSNFVEQEEIDNSFKIIKENIDYFVYQNQRLFIPGQIKYFNKYLYNHNKPYSSFASFVEYETMELYNLTHLYLIFKETSLYYSLSQFIHEKTFLYNNHLTEFPVVGSLSREKINKLLLMSGYLSLHGNKLQISNQVYKHSIQKQLRLIDSWLQAKKDVKYVGELLEKATRNLKIETTLLLYLIALTMVSTNDLCVAIACFAVLAKIYGNDNEIRIVNLSPSEQSYLKSMSYHTRYFRKDGYAYPYISHKSKLATLLKNIKEELYELSNEQAVKHYIHTQGKQEMKFAFLSGLHPRLGKNSPLQGESFFKNDLFDKNTIKTIFEFVGKEELEATRPSRSSS
jgi:hypothetical protein